MIAAFTSYGVAVAHATSLYGENWFWSVTIVLRGARGNQCYIIRESVPHD